jgi:hypothetical protein
MRLSDWFEAVQDAARRERDARDPALKAMRDDLSEGSRRLVQTMRNEAPRGS